MSYRVLRLVVAVVVAAGAVAFAADSSDADAAGYSLKLSGPSKVANGKAFVLTASGVTPGVGPVYLDVVGFDAGVVTTCPGGYDEAYQLTKSTDGGVLATSVTELRDSSGNWSAKVGGHGTDPGPVLICGYSHDTVGNTFATATFRMTVTSAARKK